jgi:hypothetical protein
MLPIHTGVRWNRADDQAAARYRRVLKTVCRPDTSRRRVLAATAVERRAALSSPLLPDVRPDGGHDHGRRGGAQ